MPSNEESLCAWGQHRSPRDTPGNSEHNRQWPFIEHLILARHWAPINLHHPRSSQPPCKIKGEKTKLTKVKDLVQGHTADLLVSQPLPLPQKAGLQVPSTTLPHRDTHTAQVSFNPAKRHQRSWHLPFSTCGGPTGCLPMECHTEGVCAQLGRSRAHPRPQVRLRSIFHRPYRLPGIHPELFPQRFLERVSASVGLSATLLVT